MFKKIKETLAITKMVFSFKSELNNWFLKEFTHEEQYQYYLEFKKDGKGTIEKLEKLMLLDKERKEIVPVEVIPEPEKSDNNNRVLRSFYVTGPQHEKELKEMQERIKANELSRE